MNVKSTLIVSIFITILMGCESSKEVIDHTGSSKLKVLIVDGENNHGTWPKTTIMMKDFLEQTGLFSVEVVRKAFTWQGPHADEILGADKRNMLLLQYRLDSDQVFTPVEEPKMDPDFNPDFESYDVVISNLGWKASDWPIKTKQSFERYMKNGGGLVIVHAANNSFGDWSEYNRMIGLGGWGGRNKESGPYVYIDEHNKVIRDPSDGACGSHGPRYEFTVKTREANHPIMKGLPSEWLHTEDELYDRLRGPAENMTILATAFSDIEKNSPPWAKDVPGTGRHEPMLMAINYEKGRVFHTGLGHNDYSMECVGFMVTLQRGTEWAASGRVTQNIPQDFPSTNATSSRSWNK